MISELNCFWGIEVNVYQSSRGVALKYADILELTVEVVWDVGIGKTKILPFGDLWDLALVGDWDR